MLHYKYRIMEPNIENSELVGLATWTSEKELKNMRMGCHVHNPPSFYDF